MPAALDRVDALDRRRRDDGASLNAADYQIATSLRLLMSFDDLAPMFEGRPAGRAAPMRVPPEASGQYPGRCSRPEWLQPPRAPAASAQ